MTPAQDAARELARSILDRLKQFQGFDTSIEVEDGIARDITAAFTQREADLRAQLDHAQIVLRRIKKWHGEFPVSGHIWPDGNNTPMSYSAAFGSNGERDFMRQLAAEALNEPFGKDEPASAKPEEKP
jgi:hypothetical protein